MTTRKKSSKKDGRRVEDSELAKEILNRQTVKSEKTDNKFVERIDDDDEESKKVSKLENEILETKHIKKEQSIVKPVEHQVDESDETNDEDMFNMFSNMMSSME